MKLFKGILVEHELNDIIAFFTHSLRDYYVII